MPEPIDLQLLTPPSASVDTRQCGVLQKENSIVQGKTAINGWYWPPDTAKLKFRETVVKALLFRRYDYFLLHTTPRYVGHISPCTVNAIAIPVDRIKQAGSTLMEAGSMRGSCSVALDFSATNLAYQVHTWVPKACSLLLPVDVDADRGVEDGGAVGRGSGRRCRRREARHVALLPTQNGRPPDKAGQHIAATPWYNPGF
ncbi:hypothetical protein ASPTUDRAFT_339019 [Aspergillus tubingensis CBS 134.48]|uniref:Uncharacterized protein n=1 Tax=Aspergillus tubingensis (strain CBS 134.48) TaxID=767770 RepID=A0A1L9NK89_ASPTC|nr:hypothetical protein ASPTUDRAFT_339019 [Aspergillus tubingensis CBS 134.48]